MHFKKGNFEFELDDTVVYLVCVMIALTLMSIFGN